MAKYNFLKLYIVKIGKNYQTFKNNKNYTSGLIDIDNSSILHMWCIR